MSMIPLSDEKSEEKIELVWSNDLRCYNDDVFKKQYVSFALQINLIKPISNFILKELNSFENYRELSYYLSKIIFY